MKCRLLLLSPPYFRRFVILTTGRGRIVGTMFTHTRKRLSHLVLLSALAITLLPGMAWAQAATCGETVFVQAGETLSIIAGRTLGSQQAYTQIVAATNAAAAIDASYARINNADVIVVGWK